MRGVDRERLVGVNPLLPLNGSRGLNPVHQTWQQQAPLRVQTSALSYLLICLFGFEARPRYAAFAGLGRPFCLSFDTVLRSSASPQIHSVVEACLDLLSCHPHLPVLGISMPRYLLTVCLGHMRASVSFLYLAVGCPSLPLDVLQKRPSQKTTLTQPPTFVLSQGTCQINQRRHKKETRNLALGQRLGKLIWDLE